jgi:hypothetical protein
MAAASCPPARPQVGFARLLVVKWVKWVCAPADCHLRLWSQPGRRGEALREGGVRAGGARAAGAAAALPLLHQRGGVLRDQRRVHACGAISAPDQRRRGQGAADRGDGGGSVDAKVVAAGSVGPTGGEVGEGGEHRAVGHKAKVCIDGGRRGVARGHTDLAKHSFLLPPLPRFRVRREGAASPAAHGLAAPPPCRSSRSSSMVLRLTPVRDCTTSGTCPLPAHTRTHPHTHQRARTIRAPPPPALRAGTWIS